MSMFVHPGFRALHIIGLSLLLTVTPVARGELEQDEYLRCPVSAPEEARSRGDLLYEQGAYQRAGQCYQAAGEFDLANRAFLRALAPERAVTVHRLSGQRDQATTMLRNV